MKAKQESKVPYTLKTLQRKEQNYFNLYIVIDGKRFELVPHSRTIKEKSYFYMLLKKTDLYEGE